MYIHILTAFPIVQKRFHHTKCSYRSIYFISAFIFGAAEDIVELPSFYHPDCDFYRLSHVTIIFIVYQFLQNILKISYFHQLSLLKSNFLLLNEVFVKKLKTVTSQLIDSQSKHQLLSTEKCKNKAKC